MGNPDPDGRQLARLGRKGDSRWAPVPESMLVDLVKQLRKKKGLKEEIPKPTDFVA